MNSVDALKVEVVDGSISVNGTNLSLPCSIVEWDALVGEYSRVEMLANILGTWDHLGVYARMGVYDLVVSSIGFAFNEYDASFIPSNFFNGELTIDGFQITADLTSADFKSANFTPIAANDFWSHQSGDISIQAVLTNDSFCCIDLEHASV